MVVQRQDFVDDLIAAATPEEIADADLRDPDPEVMNCAHCGDHVECRSALVHQCRAPALWSAFTRVWAGFGALGGMFHDDQEME